MGKLVDIETIRKQVEQWMPDNPNDDEHLNGERVAFRSVLHLLDELDPLPEEKPVGLDEAARKYAKGEGLEDAIGGWEDLSDAFKAGAEWMANQINSL